MGLIDRFKRTSIIADSVGNEVEVGLFGAMKTSSSNNQISAIFNIPLTARNYKTGGTFASQVNGSLLKVGGAPGTSFVETIKVLRYKTAQTVEFYFTAAWSRIPLIDEEALIGGFDGEDGIYVGYRGTNFVLGYRNILLGTDTSIIINMKKFDLSNIHRWRIKFGYLGVGDITLEVFSKRAWRHIGLLETDGTLKDRTHIRTAILPMRCEVTTASDLFMYSGSWNGQTWGVDHGQQDIQFYIIGTKLVSANIGQTIPILAVRSKTIFSGYTNKIKTKFLTSSISTGSKGLYRISLIVYPAGTLPDVGFTDLYPDESVLQSSIEIITLPVTPGRILSSAFISITNADETPHTDADYREEEVIINPGEELLIIKECLVEGTGDDNTWWNIAYADLF